jgi:hypothetical protein
MRNRLFLGRRRTGAAFAQFRGRHPIQ